MHTNLQEGSPAKDPDGAKRFIETLNANSLYREWTLNKDFEQGSLSKQLSLREETYHLPPGMINDLNRYMAPKDITGLLVPIASRFRLSRVNCRRSKDPVVQSYMISLAEPRSMIGHSPEAMRHVAGSQELLSNLKPLPNYKDRRSFSEASRLRACAASGSFDPGPTVSEHYRRQDPYEYALDSFKACNKERKVDFDDPNAMEPFSTHAA